MPALHPQFLIDANSRPIAVLLPIAEYETLIESMEKLEDLERACPGRGPPSSPLEQAQAELGF